MNDIQRWKIIAAVLWAMVLVVFGPVALIQALSTLFAREIPVNLETWFAAIAVVILLGGLR